MSNNHVVQETNLVTGWEMIPFPSFNQETAQMNQPTGLEMIADPSCTQEEATSEGLEGKSIPAIEADPISFFNPNTVNSSSKRKRGTASERLEILEKDFTLDKLFTSNNIEEINQGRERTLDPQELLANLKGWTVEKRRRLVNNGNGRVDTIYRHPESKKMLRSLNEVRKFIEENSYQRRASNNGEGSSQDPNVNLPSSSGELFQHPNVNISSAGEVFQDPNVNLSSSGGELFHHPIVNISSSGGELFQDPNVNFSLWGSEFFEDPNLNIYSSGAELFQHPNVNISSSVGELFHDPNVNFSTWGSEFFEDPNPNLYSLGGELFQHPNFNISSLGGGMFQDPNANFTSSGGVVLQDPLPCMNPNLHVYASMTEGYRQEQQMGSLRSSQASSSNPMIDAQIVEQVLGSSRGCNPGTDRRLTSMASSLSAHLQPQSQEPSYTQREVVDMLETQNRSMAEQVRALEVQNRATQAQVDYIQTFLRSSGITLPPTLGSGNANEERRL